MNIEDWKNFINDYSIVSCPEGVTIDITVGGSRGGNCWGDRTCEYDVNHSEIQKELEDSIKYYFNKIQPSLSQSNIEDFIVKYSMEYNYDTKSEGGDYYGNYTKYNVYELKFLDMLNYLEEQKLLEDDKEKYLEIYHSIVDINIEKLKEQNRLERISVLEKNLANLDKNKTLNLQQLKQSEEALEKQLQSVRKKITKFDQDLEKQKKQIEKELLELNLKGQQKKTQPKIK